MLRKFHGFIRSSCGNYFTCSHPLWGIVINDIAWWFIFVKGLASLGLGHQGHHPRVLFPSSIMWCFLKQHIIFEFFTQNHPKPGWWNRWFCLKKLLNPMVYVLYHAKSFIGFFNFYNCNKIIDRVYFSFKSSKGHKLRSGEPICSLGFSLLDPEPLQNP